MKAVLKKDLGQHKIGTVLHYNGYVFATGHVTIMAEDVFTDSELFEILEHNSHEESVLDKFRKANYDEKNLNNVDLSSESF
ncbi:MAG: hypothetical protein NZM26_02580 [Patescibacteria group bacterium]|nr:hypothetical protein [Patescibacteria group bacterium]